MFIDYMEQLLGPSKPNPSHTEFHWDCPFCTDTRQRFRINTDSLKCFCFNCSWGGNAIGFVQRYQSLKWHEALDIVTFYQDFRPLPQDVFEEVFDGLFLEGIDLDSLDPKKYIELPSDFQLLSSSASLQSKKFRDYAYSRGLTDRQIDIHGLGWCPEGVVKVADRKVNLDRHLFVQTFDEDNKPIYWMSRAIYESIKPKAFNPVGGVNTINKSDVLFNLNNAKKSGVVVLNEGVFDSTTVGDYGVAMFGKSLSTKQLIQLLKADLDAIYVMLDPDAWEDALKLSLLLSRHIKNVFLCNLKDGDPNEVGKAGCLRALREAEKFDQLTVLKHKLLN
ncbi:DNA primase [compost metagenome]